VTRTAIIAVLALVAATVLVVTGHLPGEAWLTLVAGLLLPSPVPTRSDQ
jgi:hypothetical protein